MKKLSFVLLALIGMACVSCSNFEEEIQPQETDIQTRLPIYTNARIDAVDAQLTPTRGIIVVTVFNNTPIYPLRTKSISLEIVDPTYGIVYADGTDIFETTIESSKTASYRFQLAFFKKLTLGRSYRIKATLTYHASITGEEYPLYGTTKTVTATAVSRLEE